MENLINTAKYDAIEVNLRNQASLLKKQYKYNPNRDWWLREVMELKRNKKNH